MNCRQYIAAVAVFFIGLGNPAFADDAEQPQIEDLPRVALLEVLDAVGKKTGYTFVIDRRVDGDVVLGQAEARKIDYSTLLVILRNNELAALRNGELVSIIPVQIIRQYALPIVDGLDESVDDEEWVTMTVDVQNTSATQFVPILRPLLPQPAHLVAHSDSNTISMVARYGNAKRLVRLIRQMDEATNSQ